MPNIHALTFFQGLCVRAWPSAMWKRSSFSRCAMSLWRNTFTTAPLDFTPVWQQDSNTASKQAMSADMLIVVAEHLHHCTTRLHTCTGVAQQHSKQADSVSITPPPSPGVQRAADNEHLALPNTKLPNSAHACHTASHTLPLACFPSFP
jgi:hypothetical protein